MPRSFIQMMQQRYPLREQTMIERYANQLYEDNLIRIHKQPHGHEEKSRVDQKPRVDQGHNWEDDIHVKVGIPNFTEKIDKESDILVDQN